MEHPEISSTMAKPSKKQPRIKQLFPSYEISK